MYLHQMRHGVFIKLFKYTFARSLLHVFAVILFNNIDEDIAIYKEFYIYLYCSKTRCVIVRMFEKIK